MISDLARHSEKLYYFYEVAHAGSLLACARKLGVSSPTISYAIKQLEQVANTQLFSRSKHGMEMTPAGLHLFNFCTKYFKELEDVQYLMKNPTKKTITRVRVGTYHSVAIYFWPYLLEHIKKRPNLSISIKTGRSDRIMESLLNREIDIALTVEGQEQRELIRHELYSDTYCAYASLDLKTHRLSRKQLRDMTLMYIPDAIDGDGITLRQHIYMTDLQLKETFEIDSFEVIAEFVKKGYGLGILPRKVASNYSGAIKEVRLEGTAKKFFGKHRLFLSYRNDLDLSQSLMELFVTSANLAVRGMDTSNMKM